jgi:two-component system cell cycle sensor histidine kinase/response regulator CckA
MATILIADDLKANRAFLATVLGHHGHRVIEVADGTKALAAIQVERPDLVITDVLMPSMDGYELVRQLRLDPATGAIPVVFYTAHYGAREARALALSGGVTDVITKPAASAEVLRIVNRVLSGERATATADTDPLPTAYDREHLRLLTDKLSEKSGDLKTCNARLRALINIGLEFASERDTARRLESVCDSAHDLFGATYVGLGILARGTPTVQRFVSCGADASWLKTGDAVPGILGTVVTERRTLRGDNPDGDPANLDLPALHPEVHAFLAAPLVSPAYVYGWICLVGNEGWTFTEEDENLVKALAGQIGRMIELEHEILEREQAESALREERDRAQLYLDTAEVILLALDPEGRVTLVNRYACSVFGWTADELLGRDFIDTCLPPRLRDEMKANLHRVVRGPDPIVESMESPIITRDGEERLIEWRNILLRDAGGSVVNTFSSGTDITERTRSANAVRTAEERMRFALEAAAVGIWDMDYTTGVLQWSPILESQYGLAPGSFGGSFRAFIDLVHPEDRDALVATMAEASRSGQDFSVQHRTLWTDGTVRWLSGAGRIRLGENGEPKRGIGISLDITERHTLELQYQQAQKMEAVGRLAGGVAHDFNNLLTTILGYCELLLMDLDPADPRQEDIAEIQKAGLSAAGLTRQLLAFSRKEIIAPSLLDLNEVVAGMRKMLERLIGEDITIMLTLRPDLARVLADRGQVEQIVLNLAINARDAMPDGGTLTIETANVELDEHYAKTHLSVIPGRYVALTVSDSGTGITPAVLARLFEPFFTTKEPGKGTGLGLATVHGVITRSGGSVAVYSEAGKGSSFKVYFPWTDATEPAEDAQLPAPRPPTGVQTVLLVEDAEGLRELTRKLLERQGYTVLVAGNAGEALELFERNLSIDVILTDVVMPGGSGPELTKRLVEQRPALKVIYMSGYTEDTIVRHGVLDPKIAFLHKPFTSDSLGRKLREVLDHPTLV